MICWAVPSSLGAKGLESVCTDPAAGAWGEGASWSEGGSDRGMTSMASAAGKQRERSREVFLFLIERTRRHSFNTDCSFLTADLILGKTAD